MVSRDSGARSVRGSTKIVFVVGQLACSWQCYSLRPVRGAPHLNADTGGSGPQKKKRRPSTPGYDSGTASR